MPSTGGSGEYGGDDVTGGADYHDHDDDNDTPEKTGFWDKVWGFCGDFLKGFAIAGPLGAIANPIYQKIKNGEKLTPEEISAMMSYDPMSSTAEGHDAFENDGGSVENIESSTGQSTEEEPSLKDVLMDQIKSQTAMGEEQWALAKPFWESMFSEENISQMTGAQDQGFEALSQLFGEATTTSPFEQSVEDYGMDWLKTGSDIMSGEWEMPSGFLNKKQDEWDILREETSRGGTFISPEGVATSTAGAQQVGQFNRTWNEREDAFGLGLLGMANQGGLGSFGAFNQNKSSEYGNLFSGMSSLLNPMYGGASNLTGNASGNISGAGNTTLGLVNSNRNKPQNNEPDFWEDLMTGTGDAVDIYLKWQMANNW